MIITEADYNDVLLLRQEVMYANKDLDFVKLPDDERGLHIGAYEHGELVSVMSIFMDGRTVQFRKLATRADMQRKGFGTALIKWLIDYANDVKIEALWCNARVEATDFYTKFAFVETGESFSKNGFDYVKMELRF